MNEPPAAWSRFRDTRRRTLDLTASLTREQMSFSPSSGKWSVGEVLDHLIQVDRLFRGELAELRRRWKDQGGGTVRLVRTLSESGFTLPMVPDALLPFLDLPAAAAGIVVPRPLRQMFLRSRAVPAKAPRRIQPRAGRSAGDLRADLAGFVDHLETYFSTDERIDWSRLRYLNPITGLTDVPGILRFVASHERRHQAQIREIVGGAAFPEAG